MKEEKAAMRWIIQEKQPARILGQRKRRMCDLEMEDLINKINACTEIEKRVILSQMDIELLWDVIAVEIIRLRAVEENGKKLFGIGG